jgi:molybdate transport system substrate-binding protein
MVSILKRIPILALLIAALLAATLTTDLNTTPPKAVPPTSAPVPPTATPFPSTTTVALRTLTVFAAASLTDAFTEIGHNFETAHQGIRVAFNFAGSQTLSMQLTQGASADIFASANHSEMDKVVAANLVQKDAPKDFLTNQLIVILPVKNPANVQTLQDLARSGLKLVLADKTVPAGKYALQILDNMVKDASFGADFKTRVLANVVSNETDVKQVVAKVQLGEADAGIAYISDSVAAPELKTIEIPSNLNVIAKYPISALVKAPQPELAAQFVAYVLSSDGQSILKKSGFSPIAP